MDGKVVYQVWRFNSSQERLTQDRQIAEFLGEISNYKGAFDLLQGFGYLAYFDAKNDRWVSYPEMAASYGEEPWASIPKGN